MAIASDSLLFGGMNKLSKVVDSNSLNLAVSIFSGNRYHTIDDCSKSFLQNPDSQRAEDLLLEFGIVFYSYHGRYHFARFDQHYTVAGAKCFVLSAGEDLPDGSQGYCIATENGSIILMKSQQDLCIPSAVLEQHELTHHFDNVFNISTEDVSSEARAFTSELCFCSNLNCIEAYRDLTLNANGASAVDSNPYHRAARVDLLAHIKGRILHGLTLGIEVSVSDFQASIASFLDSQYKEHAGLTYGQIIEPFERMG